MVPAELGWRVDWLSVRSRGGRLECAMAEGYIEILSPVAEEVADVAEPVPGVALLGGKTLALLDNRHPGVAQLMARLRELFGERSDVASILPRVKPSLSRPAPPELLDELVERAQVVVTGVGT